MAFWDVETLGRFANASKRFHDVLYDPTFFNKSVKPKLTLRQRLNFELKDVDEEYIHEKESEYNQDYRMVVKHTMPEGIIFKIVCFCDPYDFAKKSADVYATQEIRGKIMKLQRNERRYADLINKAEREQRPEQEILELKDKHDLLMDELKQLQDEQAMGREKMMLFLEGKKASDNRYTREDQYQERYETIVATDDTIARFVPETKTKANVKSDIFFSLPIECTDLLDAGVLIKAIIKHYLRKFNDYLKENDVNISYPHEEATIKDWAAVHVSVMEYAGPVDLMITQRDGSDIRDIVKNIMHEYESHRRSYKKGDTENRERMLLAHQEKQRREKEMEEKRLTVEKHKKQDTDARLRQIKFMKELLKQTINDVQRSPKQSSRKTSGFTEVCQKWIEDAKELVQLEDNDTDLTALNVINSRLLECLSNE